MLKGHSTRNKSKGNAIDQNERRVKDKHIHTTIHKKLNRGTTHLDYDKVKAALLMKDMKFLFTQLLNHRNQHSI